jgi:hypothetical protein
MISSKFNDLFHIRPRNADQPQQLETARLYTPGSPPVATDSARIRASSAWLLTTKHRA